MKLDPETFRQLVAEASLAPSTHNTQPTRWRLTAEGRVQVLADSTRRLPVGDPADHDLNMSQGCAVEGFCLAASQRGLRVAVRCDEDGVVELTLIEGGEADALAPYVQQRRTYRGRFELSASSQTALASVVAACPDVVVVDQPDRIDALAELYDEASLRWFRNAPYRAELLSWMRLSRSHPDWARDGLNAEAMKMSGFEATGAGLVLRPGVFETLDRVGLAKALVAEAAVVRSAAAIALFHRPVDEPPFETGRRFHRVWLEFTRAGLSAAPMAVLADDLEARTTIQRDFVIGPDRRLITGFRLGFAPVRDLGAKPRLPLDQLIV